MRIRSERPLQNISSSTNYSNTRHLAAKGDSTNIQIKVDDQDPALFRHSTGTGDIDGLLQNVALSINSNVTEIHVYVGQNNGNENAADNATQSNGNDILGSHNGNDNGNNNEGDNNGSNQGSGGTQQGGRGGSTYTRWGRKSCGADSLLIYHGFAGGQHYSQHGGASDYICLPLQPEYNEHAQAHSGVNTICGVEYQTYDFKVFPDELRNQSAPCARCYTPGRTTNLMIPAKTTCPNGFTLEYQGYLMSGHYSHQHAYSYACVDKQPEYIAKTSSNTNGALFYFTTMSCPHTHHCPPYTNDGIVTCVVCSF